MKCCKFFFVQLHNYTYVVITVDTSARLFAQQHFIVITVQNSVYLESEHLLVVPTSTFRVRFCL